MNPLVVLKILFYNNLLKFVIVKSSSTSFIRLLILYSIVNLYPLSFKLVNHLPLLQLKQRHIINHNYKYDGRICFCSK